MATLTGRLTEFPVNFTIYSQASQSLISIQITNAALRNCYIPFYVSVAVCVYLACIIFTVVVVVFKMYF